MMRRNVVEAGRTVLVRFMWTTLGCDGWSIDCWNGIAGTATGVAEAILVVTPTEAIKYVYSVIACLLEFRL